MIDEMIPDLADPGFRALYDVLLGRQEPTPEQKGVLLAVGMDISRSAQTGDLEIKLELPEIAYKVGLIMERAWKIDEPGVSRRLRAYVDEAMREHGNA